MVLLPVGEILQNQRTNQSGAIRRGERGRPKIALKVVARYAVPSPLFELPSRPPRQRLSVGALRFSNTSATFSAQITPRNSQEATHRETNDSGSLCHGSNPCEAAVKPWSRSTGNSEYTETLHENAVIWFLRFTPPPAALQEPIASSDPSGNAI